MKRLGWLVLAAAGGAAVAAALRGRPALDLAGRKVIIAGGSRGLGLELAREFARQGAAVGLMARDEEKLRLAAGQVREAADPTGGGAVQVETLPTDLRDHDEAEVAVRQLASRLGGIDVLVNVAGTLTVGPVQHLGVAEFREQMDSIFFTTLHASLAAVPYLRRSNGARIVNITSIGGRLAVPHLLPYTSAKFAQVGFSEGLQAELAREGIKVITVTPGLMRTGSPYRARFKGRQEKEFDWFLLLDSLPALSISSANAARRIVSACRKGQASLILPAFIRLPIAVQGLAPGLTGQMTAIAGRLLPSATDGSGEKAREGRDLRPPEKTPAFGELTRRAARRNNQLG